MKNHKNLRGKIFDIERELHSKNSGADEAISEAFTKAGIASAVSSAINSGIKLGANAIKGFFGKSGVTNTLKEVAKSKVNEAIKEAVSTVNPKIGDKNYGDIVFFVDPKKSSGLVCAMQNCNNDEYVELRENSDNLWKDPNWKNPNTDEQHVWRLPEKSELFLMYKRLHKIRKVGNFENMQYLSYDPENQELSTVNFLNGHKGPQVYDAKPYLIRAVRTFTFGLTNTLGT